MVTISEISNYIKSKPINKDQAERKMCPFPGIRAVYLHLYYPAQNIWLSRTKHIKDMKEQENKHDQEHRG